MSEGSSQRLRRRLLLCAQAAVSAGLVSWLIWRFDFQRAVSIVGSSDRAQLIYGFGVALLIIPILSLRLSALLRKGGMAMGYWDVLALSWIGQFWNFFLPGSAGGDLYKMARMIRSHPLRRTEAALAIFVDRIIATAVLVLCGGAAFFFMPAALGIWSNASLGTATRALWAILIVTLIGGAVAFFLRAKLKSITSGISQRISAGRAFWRWDRQLAAVVFWACAGHLANFSVFYFYAQAVGLPVAFGTVCVMLPAILILLILPVSLNGHGFREVLFVSVFTSLGVVPKNGASLTETVLALSVVGVGSDLLIGLIGGIGFFLKSGGAAVGRADYTTKLANNDS